MVKLDIFVERGKNMNGNLYLVSTPIGNLEDITLRAIRILKEVDVIAAEDTRQTLKLLNHFDINKPLTSFFRHNENKKGEYIVSLLKEGKNIALVSDAGTPAISDPGEELVSLAIEEGITVIPVPGPVAATSGLIISGLPTGRFTFEGFLPMNKKNRKDRLESLEQEQRTMIFYEAPHKLKSTLKDMREFLGDRKIALAREMTKIHEEVIRTTLDEAIIKYEEENPKGEFVLIVAGYDGKTEKDVFWKDLTIQEHYDYYLAQGEDRMNATKRVAKDRGVSKRDIYGELNS